MRAHVTHVASQPGPAGQWAEIVSCSCGWKVVTGTTRADAEKLARQHVADESTEAAAA